MDHLSSRLSPRLPANIPIHPRRVLSKFFYLEHFVCKSHGFTILARISAISMKTRNFKRVRIGGVLARRFQTWEKRFDARREDAGHFQQTHRIAL